MKLCFHPVDFTCIKECIITEGKEKCVRLSTCISGIDYLNCLPSWPTQMFWLSFQTHLFNEFNTSLINSTNIDHLLWAPHCIRNWPCKDDLDVDLPVNRLQWGKRHKPNFNVDYFSSPCHVLPPLLFAKHLASRKCLEKSPLMGFLLSLSFDGTSCVVTSRVGYSGPIDWFMRKCPGPSMRFSFLVRLSHKGGDKLPPGHIVFAQHMNSFKECLLTARNK